MENQNKSFDEAYAKLQQELNKREDSEKAKHMSMVDKISEFSANMLSRYLTTYLLYIHAKQNPGQMAELLSLFQESSLKEISRQTELAHEKLADDPMFNMMSNLFELPTIEGVEGMYIQEVNRLMVAYRDLFGVPQPENT